ncbi:TonB-dependent receptor [Sphingomonas aracearum]|uniref:TonB-dependent receptor n=1 Tax=Sphingomonas aracearum TaxID=2283317 RepID=A0A369VT92_9SPHN|nr:TonB-dependent receptor [Sphingomonas aracearum]RDE05624.1 TonB-dependent receptor [Sphingomonas aracearum]
MTVRTASAAQRTFLAMSCIGASLAAAAPAAAQDAQLSEAQAQEDRGSVVVTGTLIDEEPGRRLESPKRTRTVRDTPQTITVLSNEVIEQQNLLTLRDVLSTVPGITFGAAEGGTAPSDQINFRGYSATNDVTIDGVRDSAAYSRSDSFNLEQVEVTNGANSVVSGAGSAGGNINLVTKRPQEENRRVVSAGVGLDDYLRGTVDINQRVGDLVAVRLNAMAHRNDVPGRDVENYKRWGVAPSVTIGIDQPTRLILQYVHQEDTNIPQYGVPYYVGATNDGPVPGVDRSDYFGFRNIDRQRINVDQATATFEHELSDTASIRNLARWQDVRQFTVANPPQGTYCLPSGLTPTAAACAFPGYYQPSGPRGTTRDTKNLLLFDQFDFRAVFDTGAIEHTIDLGVAATWEQFELSNGNSERAADGSTVTLPLINIADPNNVVQGPNRTLAYGSNVYTGPLNFIRSGFTQGEQENYAVYLFDTMKLGKVEFNGGVRLERNTGTYRADTFSTAVATLGAYTRGATFRNANTLFSYRAGLVYKPVEPVTLYVAYGNSRTPSKSSVNGSCTVATCNIDPESAKNYEIGAKAELFDGGLLVSASAFRNERDKYAIPSNDPTIPDQVLNGRSRVDGIALSAIGKITRDWQITANYTYLDSELRQSVSDTCLARPGATGCNNNAAFPDPAAGSELANTPRHSGSIFTTYRLPFGLTIGYGATYQGSFAFGTRTLVTATSSLSTVLRADDYWVHQAYFSYEFSPNLSAQLNVKNLTDSYYFTRIRNNGWATPGDARTAVLSMTAKF